MKKIEKQVEKITKETVITYEASDGVFLKVRKNVKNMKMHIRNGLRMIKKVNTVIYIQIVAMYGIQ